MFLSSPEDKDLKYYFATIYATMIDTKNILTLSKISWSWSIFSVSVIFISFFLFSFLGSAISVQAQDASTIEPPANTTGISPEALTLNSSKSQIPIFEKESDNGIYIVQLRWNPSVSLIDNQGIDLQILFEDAHAPEQTVGTDPSITIPLLPVDSYDITFYSDDGNILWEKQNQQATAGRAFERVTFANKYTGPVDVKISDIRYSNGEVPPDSVTFKALFVK